MIRSAVPSEWLNAKKPTTWATDTIKVHQSTCEQRVYGSLEDALSGFPPACSSLTIPRSCSLLRRMLHSQELSTHRKMLPGHGTQVQFTDQQTAKMLSLALRNPFWLPVSHLRVTRPGVLPKSAARKLIKYSKHTPATFCHHCCFNRFYSLERF